MFWFVKLKKKNQHASHSSSVSFVVFFWFCVFTCPCLLQISSFASSTKVRFSPCFLFFFPPHLVLHCLLNFISCCVFRSPLLAKQPSLALLFCQVQLGGLCARRHMGFGFVPSVLLFFWFFFPLCPAFVDLLLPSSRSGPLPRS